MTNKFMILRDISCDYILKDRLISLVGRVFTKGPEDLGSISGQVISKILKLVLDTSFLNSQQYKVRI